MKDKQNCWEARRCGYGPGGSKAREEGTCPAAENEDFDGVNGGQACGRFCWTTPQTRCQESVGSKFANCLRCPFFRQVQQEEGEDFTMTRSAFVGAGLRRQDGTQEEDGPCEMLPHCRFFAVHGEDPETEAHGWGELFCRHRRGSRHCERKILRQRTGEMPPDDLTPTGIMLRRGACDATPAASSGR